MQWIYRRKGQVLINSSIVSVLGNNKKAIIIMLNIHSSEVSYYVAVLARYNTDFLTTDIIFRTQIMAGRHELFSFHVDT